MPNQDEPHLSGPLSNLRKRGDGYQAPSADYFADLAERVLAEAAPPQATVRPLAKRWWMAAASILLLLVSSLLWLQPFSEKGGALANEAVVVNYNSEALLADLDAEDINAYISDQLEDFETELYSSVAENE